MRCTSRSERAGDLAAEGAEVRRGDDDDPGGLRTALKGVDRLLLVSSPALDPARRAIQHRTAPPSTRRATPGTVTSSARASRGPAPGPRGSPRPTTPPSAR
ncbi:hypothetical protein ACFW2X_12645 [Streptomyces antibioticus]|uniref:hypothetical protein n=1 Tax=Streptomyces antibioticus TaxID=1890 RepID=UPI0036C5296B